MILLAKILGLLFLMIIYLEVSWISVVEWDARRIHGLTCAAIITGMTAALTAYIVLVMLS